MRGLSGIGTVDWEQVHRFANRKVTRRRAITITAMKRRAKGNTRTMARLYHNGCIAISEYQPQNNGLQQPARSRPYATAAELLRRQSRPGRQSIISPRQETTPYEIHLHSSGQEWTKTIALMVKKVAGDDRFGTNH